MKLHHIRSRELAEPAERIGAVDSLGRDRLARLSAVAVPPVLGAIAALHVGWALGWRWPGGSDSALAEHVLSASERDRLGSGELPPVPLTLAVAVTLVGGAVIVRSVAAGKRSRALRAAAWGVSGVLLARGVVYVPSDLIGGLEDTYQRLDLAIYSPLCLALGGATAWLLKRGTGAGEAGRGEPRGTA